MVCVNNATVILLTIVMMVIILVQYLIFIHRCMYNSASPNNIPVPTQEPPIDNPIINPIVQPAITVPMIPPINPDIADPVKVYDYQKLVDPLEEPTKRVDRYLLGPIEMRRMFNYPVRGYPDNPRWMGILISNDEHTPDSCNDGHCNSDKDNRIIKLFGRQKFPGSTHYEYYTMINMGNDQIKIHIHRRNELYDGDEVHIPELRQKYKVKLNKDDDNSYNPYF